MIKILSVLLIFVSNILDAIVMRCNSGRGTATNPCRINMYLLNPDDISPTVIDIPSNIDHAIINCGRNSCQNRNVMAFLGAKKTRIICPESDSCVGSKFYCGRGPPDSNQDDYRQRNGLLSECILDLRYRKISPAREVEFVVYPTGKGLVDAIGESAFSASIYRCYSDSCELNCQTPTACANSVTYHGSQRVLCRGNCIDLAPIVPMIELSPIIATPINGECVLNPTDILNTDPTQAIVFTNKCVRATLNCIDFPGICQKRTIYCGAIDSCDIVCGSAYLDTAKSGELIDGACKESHMIFGPVTPGDLPGKLTEQMFDRLKPTTLSVIILFTGVDAGSNSIIDAVLSDVDITADGANTFSQGKVNCGFNIGGAISENGVILNTCKVTCNDDVNGPACDFCSFAQSKAVFISHGSTCNAFEFTL